MDTSATSQVVNVLQQALSPDNNVLRPAQQQLQKWEVEQGFYSTLLVSELFFC